jgi:hypothetical protein
MCLNWKKIAAVAGFGFSAEQTSWAIEASSGHFGALQVSDPASTVVLLGMTLAGLGALHRFRGRK